MKEFKGILPQPGGVWDQTSDVRVLLAVIVRIMNEYQKPLSDEDQELIGDGM